MQKVQSANPFRYNALGSFGDANLMIVRQYNFPFIHEDHEQHCSADHDRLMQHDYDYATTCIRKHTGSGELVLGQWFNESPDEKVISFIKEYFRADSNVIWTGYRIRGSVHKTSGQTIWSLDLFSKDPKSTTEVYSDLEAPNVSKETVPSGYLLNY
jgi:hypothetical protein